MKIYAASACLPGRSHRDAVAGICAGITEDGIEGKLDQHKIQLCPQHHTAVTNDAIDALMAEHPEIEFRLHASVRLGKAFESNSPTHDRQIWDASNAHSGQIWFKEAARLSQRMKAPAYTLHAGSRKNATIEKMAANVRDLAQSFGCRVGVEGLYPVTNDLWLLSSWAEYAWLLNSGIDYALDLSHLNILANRSRRVESTLVKELVESPHCIEIHVSGNDGRHDEHKPLSVCQPWWWVILQQSHTTADVFSEGNQMRKEGT